MLDPFLHEQIRNERSPAIERWCRQCRREVAGFYPGEGNICPDCYLADNALRACFRSRAGTTTQMVEQSLDDWSERP